jgi:heptosyltransferase I
MENFLIIRTSSLGDVIHTLPAFAALRKSFPGARIAWVIEEKSRPILDFVSGIDEIIVVGSRRWRKKIRRKHQTALDFQGLLKSGLIAWLSGSRRRFGFDRRNLKEPAAAFFYTRRLEPVTEEDHVIRKNLKLLELVGVKTDKFDFPLTIPEEARREVLAKIDQGGWSADRKLILFNVGAAWPTKRWSAENWIAVLNELKNEILASLLLWGTPEEEAIAEFVSQETGVPMAPFLTVKEILALVQSAALLVSGDTFALQAACALGVRVIGIFGPTDPRRNGPFRSADKIVYHPMSCSLCYRRDCESTECLDRVKPDEILTLIKSYARENA